MISAEWCLADSENNEYNLEIAVKVAQICKCNFFDQKMVTVAHSIE